MDTKHRTVVAGHDLSETSEEAVRVALSTAGAAQRGNLHLVHVVPISALAPELGPPVPIEETLSAAREQMAALARRLDVPPNVAVSIHVVVGKADDVLVEIADSVEADLIVVGTHGRRGVSRMVLGSVAEQVVRKAPCSVLTARPHRRTAAESIEPPCPACAAASERAGRRASCERHTRQHPHAHTYAEMPPTFGIGSLTFRFPG